MAPRKRQVSAKQNVEENRKQAKKAKEESTSKMVGVKKPKHGKNPVEQDAAVNKGESRTKAKHNKASDEKDSNDSNKRAEGSRENIKSKKTTEKESKEKISDKGRKRKVVDEEEKEEENVKNKGKQVTKGSNSSGPSKKKVKKEKREDTEDESKEDVNELIDSKSSKITREMIQNSQKWVGAHVSIAGGLYKAVEEACSLESNAFGLFLRSQRRWESPPLAQKSIEEFERKIKEKKFGCSVNMTSKINDSSYFDSIKNQILPHGSYLINLGNSDKGKREKSYSVFLDDLKRCDSLSIALYNFHPGSTCGETTIENSIALIAEGINNAHKETKHVKIVIENMAGQGNIVGSKFEELADIIKLIENKSRVGICLDTCHLFAAGYDVRTAEAWNKTLDEFDKIVGLKYLSALHLNDSKGPLGCNKDRHESIGKGYIGVDCFKFIMEDSRFCNMPLILETPDEKLYFKEIQLLHSFLKPLPKKEEIN